MFTNLNKNSIQTYFMRLALMQAQKNLGNTKENPSVGCVITRNNHVISAGSTSPSGRPHAEKNAIIQSKTALDNSHLYVTLEPCSHYGKTPPCVNLIAKKKIKKVFFSIKDPDVRSFNKSTIKLKKMGVKVNSGLYKNKINYFYKSYLKSKKKGLPFVTCKLAMSKDYFTNNKQSKTITNNFSRGRVHLMRSYHDSIMTTSETINKDNPKLTCRINGLKENSPSKIILDNKLKILTNSKIFNEASNSRTLIFYNKINKKKIKLLKKLKITLFRIPLDKDGNLDLNKSLIKAKKLGFSRIFLESGIKLSTNFLAKNLIDDFMLFISNKNLRGNGNYSFKKSFEVFLKNKENTTVKVNLMGDKLIAYKLK